MSEHTVAVIAAVIINSSQEVLLAKRPAEKRHGNLWEFPGGKLEPGESYQDAAERELQEELGIKLLSLGTCLFKQRDPGSPFEVSFYFVRILGTPRPLEHQALAWGNKAELLSFDLAPSDRAFALLLPTLELPS